MREHLQSGYHPDADQISAFVEHALPAHEREQMLDHLAACEECRAVVAMSLPEVEEPEPARMPHAAPRRSWWSGWMLAWSLTGALAAVVLSVIFIRNAVIAPSTQSPNRIAGAQAPQPVSHLQPPASPEKPHSRGVPEKAASVNSAASGISGNIQLQRNANAPAISSGFASVPMQARNVAPLDQKTPASIANPGNGIVSGMVAAPRSGLDAHTQAPAPSPAVAATPPAPTIPAGTAMALAGETQTVTVTNASPIEPATVNATGADNSLNEVQLAQLIQVRNPLPSHLAVLSIAASGRRIVAIDTHNAVFLSNDAGKHWKTVQTEWQGRPEKAILVEFPTANRNFAQLKSLAPGVAAGMAAGSQKTADAIQQSNQPVAACCSLTGTVTDRTGAVISDASVSITNTASHDEQSAKTDSAGHYVIGGLAPGTYQLQADARGFMRQAIAGVCVTDSHPTVKDLSLEVGSSSETVTVEADPNEISLKKESSAKKKPTAPVTGIFEIVTDNGEHWTSSDGITWRRM